MPSCSFRGCKNTSRNTNKDEGVTFHAFPRDPRIKEKWIKVIQLERREDVWIPSTCSKVCSAHFSKDDFLSTKSGRLKVLSSVVPTFTKNPGSSASKRKCDGSLEASINTESQGDDDSTGDDDHDITPRTHHHDFQTSEAHDQNELALHEGCRCQVCHRDIIGFRYTCVQCADWDMCASCEARGEHPAHYVLRLPEPKPSAETERVLAAIRKDIEDLLKLNNEMHEIIIKEEVYDEVNVEMDTTEPMLEMYDRCVPEVEQANQSTPDTAAAVPTTHTASHDARDEENEANRILQTGVKLEMDTTQASLEMYEGSVSEVEQAHHATSTVAAPASTLTAVPTTHTASFSERDEDIEAVRILQTIKMEPTEDPLL